MKLDLFNSWKPLGGVAGIKLEYQTSSTQGKAFITYIRDAKSKKVITKGFGVSKETSQKSSTDNLHRIGIDGIRHAIETGQPVVPGHNIPQPPKGRDDVEWWDGVGHSYKAQKKLLGESFIIEADESLDDNFKNIITRRNFVAKNAHKVNKAGPMKDKKNDYSRKKKKKDCEETE